jgi:hypothetical protein
MMSRCPVCLAHMSYQPTIPGAGGHRRSSHSSFVPALVIACLTAAAPGAAPAAASCNSDNSLVHEFHGSLNQDFGDYGVIYKEASTTGCAASAASALLDKVTATLAVPTHSDDLGHSHGPYQGWLEGGGAALAAAAALELGGQGLLTSPLDAKLEQVRTDYATSSIPGLDPGCGFDGGRWVNDNTCMDDYTVAASAFAWLAAYEHARGRSAATSLISQANNAINLALPSSTTVTTSESICIYTPTAVVNVTGRGPCNGSFSDLQTGKGSVVSLNHGFEDIPYGLGLMTCVAAAFAGLGQSGVSPSLTSDQKVIAMALFQEAQEKTLSNGSAFKSDCYSFDIQSLALGVTTNKPCSDAAYSPQVFPVRTFYETYGFGTPLTEVGDEGVSQAAYQFNTFDASPFSTDPMDDAMILSPARYVYFGVWTLYWYTMSRPVLSGVLNDYNPIGFLDGIDANGCASGWACDQDSPTEAVRVDFYINGFSQYIQSASANMGSEAAVNSQCGGGTAHRFQSCLPASTKGQLIYAYGIDLNDPIGRNWGSLPGWQCANDPACVW